MNYNSSEEIVISGADLENAEKQIKSEQPQEDETCEFIVGDEKPQLQPKEDICEFTLEEERSVINGEKSTSGIVNISLPAEGELNARTENKGTVSYAAQKNNSSEPLPSVKPAGTPKTNKSMPEAELSKVPKKHKEKTPVQPAQKKKSKPQQSAKTAKKQKKSRGSASTQPDKKIEKSEKTGKSCLAVISLVLGVASVLLLGIVWGVAGIVLSAISLKKKKSRKIALAGLIVSCVGILASAAAMLLVFLF